VEDVVVFVLASPAQLSIGGQAVALPELDDFELVAGRVVGTLLLRVGSILGPILVAQLYTSIVGHAIVKILK
jgi:hypothetical protein